MNPATSTLGTWIQRVVGAFTLALVISMLIRPEMSTVGYNRVVVGVGCVLFVAVVLILGWRRAGSAPGADTPSRSWDLAAVVLMVGGSVGAAVVGWASAYQPTWDTARIQIDSALKPADFGAFAHTYYSRFPNNATMMATARLARRGESTLHLSYQNVFVIINTVSFLATAIALYLTVRMIRGPRWGTAALVPFIALIGLSSWMSIPYTDMLALWAPMVAVCCFVAGIRRTGWSRYALLAAAGIPLGVGYAIKTTPLVGLAASLVVLLFMFFTRVRPTRPATVAMAAVLLIGVAVSVVGTQAWARSAADVGHLTPGISRQPLAYVADGQMIQHTKVSGRTTYGSWDRAVEGATYNRSAASQDRAVKKLIKDTLTKRGVLGEVRFAVKKTQFNWGDGTFWARGEGTDLLQPPKHHNLIARIVNSWAAPTGRLWSTWTDATNILWFSILALAGIGLLRSRYDPDVLLLTMTTVGIALFVLIFQARSRYLIGHVPVVIALAACVIPLAFGSRAGRRRT